MNRCRNVGTYKAYWYMYLFQMKEGGQALPEDVVTTAREKFERLVIANNLIDSNDDEYCEVLEKKFFDGRERDSKSKGGCMYLR